MFHIFLQAIATRILYLALHLESGSFPRPLSPAAEQAAFAKLAAGDPSARDHIIRHNLRLVAHIAKKYYPSGEDRDDLISVGVIGLIKAVNSFDPARQARFSTYASRCIENELRMQFRRQRKEPPAVSLQDPLEGGREDGSLTVADVLTDDFVLDADCERQEDRRHLHRLLRTLNERDRQVLLLRYGLAGLPPLTQQQVAERLCLSRSYISRIEKRAMAALRHKWD